MKSAPSSRTEVTGGPQLMMPRIRYISKSSELVPNAYFIQKIKRPDICNFIKSDLFKKLNTEIFQRNLRKYLFSQICETLTGLMSLSRACRKSPLPTHSFSIACGS